MKILVIGGSGHIGKFLTPMLVERGDEVVVASRGTTAVPDTDAWSKVDLRQATYARDDAAWGEFVAGVGAEAVIDIMGTDVLGTYEASARSGCKHLIACGSLNRGGQYNAGQIARRRSRASSSGKSRCARKAWAGRRAMMPP